MTNFVALDDDLGRLGLTLTLKFFIISIELGLTNKSVISQNFDQHRVNLKIFILIFHLA